MKQTYNFLSAASFAVFLLMFACMVSCTSSGPTPDDVLNVPAKMTGGKTETATATSTAIEVVEMPAKRPAVVESTCPGVGEYQAVDASEPVTTRFLEVMKWLKVKTIIRYGDYVNETIRGKTPKAAELKLIREAGFDMRFVFQHNNSSINSFTTARGTGDANRMKELYPAESIFYFGVDGEFEKSDEQAKVKTYAVAFAAVARTAGKKVGVYGSGLTCKNLMAAGLVDACWLANATGWTGTPAFTATMKWLMKQSLPKNCGGINVDFDKINPALKFL